MRSPVAVRISASSLNFLEDFGGRIAVEAHGHVAPKTGVLVGLMSQFFGKVIVASSHRGPSGDEQRLRIVVQRAVFQAGADDVVEDPSRSVLTDRIGHTHLIGFSGHGFGSVVVAFGHELACQLQLGAGIRCRHAVDGSRGPDLGSARHDLIGQLLHPLPIGGGQELSVRRNGLEPGCGVLHLASVRRLLGHLELVGAVRRAIQGRVVETQPVGQIAFLIGA